MVGYCKLNHAPQARLGITVRLYALRDFCAIFGYLLIDFSRRCLFLDRQQVLRTEEDAASWILHVLYPFRDSSFQLQILHTTGEH